MAKAGHDQERRDRRWVLAAAAAGVLAVAVGVGIVGSSGDEGSAADRSRQSPDPLSVELATFDGEAVQLGRYLERPVVVNFFASWCGPCAREMPDFEAVHVARGGEVTFVGVSLQDTAEAALELVERTGVTYDVVRDTDSALFRAVGATSMPTTVFLSAAGEIVEVHGGELPPRLLEERIDRLLAVS